MNWRPCERLPSKSTVQINGAVLLLGNVVVVASPLLGYRLASYTWLIWMGCLVPFLVGYALSKVRQMSSVQHRQCKGHEGPCFTSFKSMLLSLFTKQPDLLLPRHLPLTKNLLSNSREIVGDQVEVLTEGVTREDKLLVISLAIFLSLAAGLLLEFLPAQYLDFQWDSATAELGWLVTSVRRKLDIHMMVIFMSMCRKEDSFLGGLGYEW